jgi:hypothetical protein
MSRHPLNLALRLVLELCILAALAYGGWTVTPFPVCYIVGLALPIAAGYAWATFRVPNDGGAPRVTVSGRARLAIEAVLFAAAVALLAAAGHPRLALAFAAVTAAHYAVSADRTLALVRNQPLAPASPSMG